MAINRQPVTLISRESFAKQWGWKPDLEDWLGGETVVSITGDFSLEKFGMKRKIKDFLL